MNRLLRYTTCFLLTVAAAPAQDDREQTATVPTVVRTGQSTVDLDIMRQTDLRPTDLEVESTSPLRFIVTAVSNQPTTPYRKTWWYVADATTSQVSAQLAANNARLIDLETWDSGGTVKHAALMISNTGQDARTWWWYAGISALQVNSFVNANGARLINLERYSSGGSTRFSCVMVANSGAHARAFRHFYDTTLSTIESWNAANGMRVYDIERVSQDRFDAIVVESRGETWWHYYGLSESRMRTLQAQQLGRIIDIERRALFGGLVQYDIVMLDNARNELERRTRAILSGTDGVTGAFLERVGGGRSAYINSDFAFEPGTAMMTVHLAHAIRELAEHRVTVRDRIVYNAGRVGSCPTGTGGTRSQDFLAALDLMMRFDETRIAYGIEQRFNAPTIQDTMSALGLQETQLNHPVGCVSSTANRATLEDLGRLYGQMASGFYAGSTGAVYFVDALRNSQQFPSWGGVSLEHRVQTYGAALGLSAASVERFLDGVELAYMPGTDSVGGLHYNSESGYFRAPFRDPAGNLMPVEYVFGAFDHGGSDSGVSRVAVSEAAHELVWDKVRAALDTWAGVYTITVRSENPVAGVGFNVSPGDENGFWSGRTEHELDYFDGTTVTLTAAPKFGCNTFRRWVLGGVPQFVGLRQVSFQVSGDMTAVAEYRAIEPGTVTPLGPGCPGRNGLIPAHTISHGNGSCGPQQGTATTYELADAVASTVGVLHLGSDTQFFGSIPLPWDLSSIGATGCLLNHDPLVSPPVQVDLQGRASLTFTWPVSSAAVGATFHSTFAILDFAANPLGLVHSNALSAAQGGSL